MPIKKILILALLLITQKALARVSSDISSCTMNLPLNIELASEQENAENSISAQVTLSFLNTSFPIPLIKLETDTIINESHIIEIQWPSVELANSRNQSFFDQNYENIVRENLSSPFTLYAESSLEFGGGFWGFSRVQTFVSLLHSQRDFRIIVKSRTGHVLGESQVSLSGSDIAFRTMAQSCFPTRTSAYLQGVNRVQGVGASWENSYGIIDFSQIKSLSYPLYIENFELIGDPEQQSIRLSESLNLLSSYLDIYNEYSLLEGSNETQQLLQAIDPLLRNFQFYHLAITNFDNPEIGEQHLNAQLGSLNGRLQWLNSILQKLEESQGGVENELSINEREFDDLSVQLALIGVNLTTTRARLQDIENKIAAIDELSAHPILGSLISELDLSAASPQLNHDNFVELMSHVETIENNRSLFQQSENSLYLIALIKGQLDRLEVANQEILEKRESILNYRRQIVNQERQLQNELDLIALLFDQYYGLSDARLRELLTTNIQSGNAESILSSTDLLNDVRSSYQSFDSHLIEVAESLERSDLIPKIVCNTDSFKRDYHGHCLDIRDIQNQSRIIYFFENLPSDQLIELGELFGKGNQRFNDQNFMEEILLDWTVLWSVVPVEELTAKWEEVLFARWKYFKSRDLSFNDVTLPRLLGVLDEITTEITTRQARVSEIRAEISMIQGQYSTGLIDFRESERLFLGFVSNISSYIRTYLELNPESVHSQQLNCFIIQQQPLNCLNLTNSLALEVTEQLNQLDSDFEELMTGFETSVTSEILFLQTQQNSHREEESRIQTAYDEFIATHDLEEKENIIQGLRAHRDLLVRRIHAVTQLHASLSNRSSNLDSELYHKRRRHFQHLERRAEVVESLRPYLAQMESYCVATQSLIDSWSVLQQQSRSGLELQLANPPWLENLNGRCQLNLTALTQLMQ